MKNYFEGWYFKNQNKDNTIAIIPALHYDSSSIQVITDNTSHSFLFSKRDFYIDKDSFYVKVGNNEFSNDGIKIDLKDREFRAYGELHYGKFTTLKYDIMGPFKYVPFMQCTHKVLSLMHSISGVLTVNENKINFNNGIGYTESDRGRGFPSSYFWTQCNIFDNETCSVVISIADIPYLTLRFLGCICSIWYKNKEYRIATYLGAKVLQYSNSKIIIKQGRYTIRADLLSKKPHSLYAPDNKSMQRIINENIACTIRYRFYKDNNSVFDLTSNRASYEYER